MKPAKLCLDCGVTTGRPGQAKRCLSCSAEHTRVKNLLWHRAHPEYRAKWLEQNPSKSVEYQKRYRSKPETKTFLARCMREWRAANREHVNAIDRARYPTRKHKMAVYGRAYIARVRHTESYQRRASARTRRWEKRHPEQARELKRYAAQRRRARLHDSCSPGVTSAEWAAVCDEFTVDGTVYCAYCEKTATSVDHVRPVSRGGRDEKGNVVPACRQCNTSKHNKRLLWQWLGRGLRCARLEVA